MIETNFYNLFLELEKKSVLLGLRKATISELTEEEIINFNNCGLFVNRLNWGNSTNLYLVTKTEEVAEILLNESNNRCFGEFLGYPKCCVDEFCKQNITRQHTGLPFYSILNTKNLTINDKTAIVKFNPFCFIISRHLAVKFIPHTPCSFDCEESIQLGKQWYEKMIEIDKDTALEAFNMFNREFEIKIDNNHYLMSDGIRTWEMRKLKEKIPTNITKIRLIPDARS